MPVETNGYHWENEIKPRLREALDRGELCGGSIYGYTLISVYSNTAVVECGCGSRGKITLPVKIDPLYEINPWEDYAIEMSATTEFEQVPFDLSMWAHTKSGITVGGDSLTGVTDPVESVRTWLGTDNAKDMRDAIWKKHGDTSRLYVTQSLTGRWLFIMDWEGDLSDIAISRWWEDLKRPKPKLVDAAPKKDAAKSKKDTAKSISKKPDDFYFDSKLFKNALDKLIDDANRKSSFNSANLSYRTDTGLSVYSSISKPCRHSFGSRRDRRAGKIYETCLLCGFQRKTFEE